LEAGCPWIFNRGKYFMVATSKTSINESELRSMEIYYLPVRSSDVGTISAYISQLRINDPEMGVLLPELYMPIAERSAQAIKVTDWAMNSIFRDINKFRARGSYFDWISLYVPVKVLLDVDFIEKLRKCAEAAEVQLNDICLEIASTVLYEDDQTVTQVLNDLNKLEVKTMISGFGDEYCPVNRISAIRPDYVSLTDYVTEILQSDDEARKASIKSLYDMLNTLKIKVITSSIQDDDMVNLIPETGRLCTGKYAGAYRKPRSVR
jgi:EAL domain-containing protein (putative c-di-GMP-specific phosphodiesterase class I)